MTRTRNDVVTRAARQIGVVAQDETPDADTYAQFNDVLQGFFDEIVSVEGATITWTLDTVPDGAYLPLSRVLSAHMAGEYDRPYASVNSTMIRLRGYLYPSNADDRRDTDDDGTVTTDEAEAGLKTAFY